MHANVTQLLKENGAIRGVRYLAPDGAHEIRARLRSARTADFPCSAAWRVLSRLRLPLQWMCCGFAFPKCPANLKSSAARSAASEAVESSFFWSATTIGRLDWYSRRGSISSSALRVWNLFAAASAQIEPRFAPHAESLADWHQITLLSVESSRCPLWHKPGLLLIGDAAHVMSPVGGVGINYAIQDAVSPQTFWLLTESGRGFRWRISPRCSASASGRSASFSRPNPFYRDASSPAP